MPLRGHLCRRIRRDPAGSGEVPLESHLSTGLLRAQTPTSFSSLCLPDWAPGDMPTCRFTPAGLNALAEWVRGASPSPLAHVWTGKPFGGICYSSGSPLQATLLPKGLLAAPGEAFVCHDERKARCWPSVGRGQGCRWAPFNAQGSLCNKGSPGPWCPQRQGCNDASLLRPRDPTPRYTRPREITYVSIKNMHKNIGGSFIHKSLKTVQKSTDRIMDNKL